MAQVGSSGSTHGSLGATRTLALAFGVAGFLAVVIGSSMDVVRVGRFGLEVSGSPTAIDPDIKTFLVVVGVVGLLSVLLAQIPYRGGWRSSG